MSLTTEQSAAYALAELLATELGDLSHRMMLLVTAFTAGILTIPESGLPAEDPLENTINHTSDGLRRVMDQMQSLAFNLDEVLAQPLAAIHAENLDGSKW